MTQPARRLNGWQNRLPDWIMTSEAYDRLNAGARATLHAVGNACDPPSADGSLTGARGGCQLFRAAGVSRSTFFRHVARLEALSFIVLLSRGGTLNHRNWANVYGIPGSPAALNDRRARRSVTRMVLCDDGRYRPEHHQPGDQLTLWHRDELPDDPADNSQIFTGGVVSKRDGGSVILTRGWCQNETPPSPGESPGEKNHGAGAAKTRPGPARMNRVLDADLTDLGRLLALHVDAVARGYIGPSDDDRLRFVAMAEHVLRVGRLTDRPAAFAANIRKQRWLFISQGDEIAAQRRLTEHLHGPQRSAGPIQPQDVPARPADRQLSEDARTVQRVLAAVKTIGTRQEPLQICRTRYGDAWTATRWAAAAAELDACAIPRVP